MWCAKRCKSGVARPKHRAGVPHSVENRQPDSAQRRGFRMSIWRESLVTSSQSAQDPGTPEEISRRTFMAGATVVLGGIVGLGVAIPAITTLFPTKEIIAGSKS